MAERPQNIVVVGGTGQLANAFRLLLPHAVFVTRNELDLVYPEKVKGVLGALKPEVLINAAAYTLVDKAETEEALAHAVNAESPREMARYCAGEGVPFVHFSTDYVFNGSGAAPWRETDTPDPLNAYGRSKLAGERAVVEAGGKYLLLRTSWVYDAHGKNFVNAILRLAAEREELRVIDDQFGAPTYAPHLAAAAWQALQNAIPMADFASGIYHLCNAGETTWCRFATRIIEHARVIGLPVTTRIIHPIGATEYPLPAPRPYNSRLDCGKVQTILGVRMPLWEEGLKACMELKSERH